MVEEQMFNFKRRVHTWLKNFESVYGPARAIREGDLLLRQELVANKML